MSSHLAESDCHIAIECVHAAAHGPFFCDYDIRLLIECERVDLVDLARRGSDVDWEDTQVRRVVASTLGNLLALPDGLESDWSNWISASPAECEAVYRLLVPPIEYASFEVHGPIEVAGRYYRVVAYSTTRGGRGLVSQVWTDERWRMPAPGPEEDACPSAKSILEAEPADTDHLRLARVDTSPVPDDPLGE